MSLKLLEHALQTCESHLDASNARNSEVEAYLTRYLLVLAVAVFEEHFEELIATRAGKAGDEPIAAFVKSATNQLLRHTKFSDLKGFLGRFGPQHPEAFERGVTSGRTLAAFDAIVRSRHEVAHRGGQNTQMTFNDLCQNVKDSIQILSAFENSLGLP